MTQTQIEDLRKAVVAYRQDRDDSPLLDWIQQAEILRVWRAAGTVGTGAYLHLRERSPAGDEEE